MKKMTVLVGLMSIALIGAATKTTILDVVKENGTEIAAVNEVQKPKRTVEGITLNLDTQRRFKNYTIYYNEGYFVVDSLDNLVDELNARTNDTYILSETGKLMRIDDKTAVVVDVSTAIVE